MLPSKVNNLINFNICAKMLPVHWNLLNKETGNQQEAEV